MDLALSTIELLDAGLVWVDEWVGYLLPDMPYPNENYACSYWLRIDGDTSVALNVGDLNTVVWETMMRLEQPQALAMAGTTQYWTAS